MPAISANAGWGPACWWPRSSSAGFRDTNRFLSFSENWRRWLCLSRRLSNAERRRRVSYARAATFNGESGDPQALVQETTSRQSGSVAGMLGSAVSGLLGGGIGFSPIISGLLDLFGGGNATPPPPLVHFSLPPSLSFQAANASPYNALGLPGADYSQSGMP